eukprot:6187567-Pleurochrysis_carterae.AAC.1
MRHNKEGATVTLQSIDNVAHPWLAFVVAILRRKPPIPHRAPTAHKKYSIFCVGKDCLAKRQ